MEDLKEEHVIIRFSFKLGENAMETFKMLKAALGQQIMRRTQVFWGWFSKVKSCVSYVKDAESLGHLLMSKTDENVSRVKELVFKNRRIISAKLLTCWEFHLAQFKAF
jgi:hypothetical protein